MGSSGPKIPKNGKKKNGLGRVFLHPIFCFFGFCQKVRLTPCTGGPKILTVFGIFIVKGPLGENALAECCQTF